MKFSLFVLQLSKSPMHMDETMGDQALSNPNTPTDKTKPVDKLVIFSPLNRTCDGSSTSTIVIAAKIHIKRTQMSKQKCCRFHSHNCYHMYSMWTRSENKKIAVWFNRTRFSHIVFYFVAAYKPTAEWWVTRHEQPTTK